MSTKNAVVLSNDGDNQGKYVHQDGRVLGDSITLELAGSVEKKQVGDRIIRLYRADLVHPDGTKEEITFIPGTAPIEFTKVSEAMRESIDAPGTRHVMTAKTFGLPGTPKKSYVMVNGYLPELLRPGVAPQVEFA